MVGVKCGVVHFWMGCLMTCIVNCCLTVAFIISVLKVHLCLLQFVMSIIQVVSEYGVGLKYIPNNDAVVVQTHDAVMRELLNPPNHGELQTLTRQMLLSLVRTWGRPVSSNATKTVLIDIVINGWQQITQRYADNLGLDSIFESELFNDDDDETNSDTSSINPPTMFEYHGQPHRQEPLPQGWNTPRSVATTEVINSDEPQHFSSDTSDAGLSEAPSGSQDVVAVEMDKFEMDENPNIKSLHGKTFNIASIDKPSFKVFVVIPMKHTEVRFKLVVDAGVKVEDLFEMVGNKTGGTIPSGEISAYVKDVSSEVYPSEPISWFCDDGHTLLLRPRVRGGGRLVKKEFLKNKTDGIKFLKTQIEKNYSPDPDSDIKDEDLTAEFLTFVAKMNDGFNECLALQNRCQGNFIRLSLRHINVENLKVLDNLFASRKAGRRNMTTEEKVIKGLELIFPTMNVLDNSTQKLQQMKQEMTMTLMKIFADEYHQFSEASGSIVLDGQGFHQVVIGELRARQLPTIAENSDAPACVIQ